jgi:uncharacterized UBP type Zn finger protein
MTTILERIERNTFHSPDGCWYWLAGTNVNGYGTIGNKGKSYLVHRVLYSILVKDPGCLNVCHTCDNPLCINPHHMFLGTQADNVRDMVRKGRRARTTGENNPKSKLTNDQVYKIRELVTGKNDQQIADLFNVSKTTICAIRNNKIWTELNPLTSTLD